MYVFGLLRAFTHIYRAVPPSALVREMFPGRADEGYIYPNPMNH